MKCCMVRKVAYRLPGSKRLVWAVVLAEREGLSLIFIQKANESGSHALVIATENVAERVYENVNTNLFPLEHEDLTDIASKLEALGNGLSQEEFKKFFQIDDD